MKGKFTPEQVYDGTLVLVMQRDIDREGNESIIKRSELKGLQGGGGTSTPH